MDSVVRTFNSVPYVQNAKNPYANKPSPAQSQPPKAPKK